MHADTNVGPVQVFSWWLRAVPHHHDLVEVWQTFKTTYCIYQNSLTFVRQYNDYKQCRHHNHHCIINNTWTNSKGTLH